MIEFRQGNLLDAKMEAVVNTYKTVGVMGKGIALMFKEALPDNFKSYKAASDRKAVKIGNMFVTENLTLDGPRWIINFPTKKHWRQPTKLEWVVEGLQDLRRVILERGIRSVAIPPLGCGNGGLAWDGVRPQIESALRDLHGVDVIVYEPTSKYQNIAKRTGVTELTPARALVAEMVRRYWVLGIECTYLAVQKLCWFLERSIHDMHLKDPLDLRFVADKYGPYSDRLRHLLHGLDGSYLHCDKRLADAGPSDTIWFDESRRAYLDAYLKQGEAQSLTEVLDRTERRIDGFESPLGMELLSTVDWLIVREHCEASVSGIRKGLAAWPAGTEAGERKLHLFDDRMLQLALGRLAT
jgi:O-acetyl-ADP-ribose deacetylase (regulator of RNase III)